ncbi:MAG TPA: molybdate ABC transporter substrate-binding protein [Actinomycetales bacterium]|jgi:molybdate transport system substrate-binding protein
MRRPVTLTVLALLLAGCSSSAPAPAAGTSADRLGGSITVLAAASLRTTFTAIGEQLERQNPGVRVAFSFGPSSGLATQIVQGAPADVFASASSRTMQTVTEAGAATAPRVFATNRLAIAVPPDNPGGVTRLADLARSDVTVAVCQQQVPCGVVAREVLTRSGTVVRPVTEEADVGAVLTKVRLGEVDAGLVYVTDVRAAGDAVRGIAVPDDVNATTDYPIAVLTGAGADAAAATTAQAFVDQVLAAKGQAVLAEAGFGSP